MRNLLLLLAAIVTFGGTFMSNSNAQAAPGTIVDVAASTGTFNTLLAAATSAGLAGLLSSDGPFTVFAPTDEAFAKLNAGTVESLLKPANRDKLTSILLYHVIPGKVSAAQVVGSQSLETALGAKLSVVASASGVQVGGAKVVATDIAASNGVIHVIDSVMIPANIVELASNAGTFSTLLAAATAAGLVGTLSNDGPFTVFAPTDEAFAALPAGTVESLLKPENLNQLKSILLYHVLPRRLASSEVAQLSAAKTIGGQQLTLKSAAGSLMVDQAQVLAGDLQALNGVVHVIDMVLIPGSIAAVSQQGSTCSN